MSENNTPSGVPMMTGFESDFISGAVSLVRLLSLYGFDYLEEVDTLWGTDGTDFIVLFANDDETEYALLPVGPAHPNKSLAKTLEMHVDGLHPVFHAAARDGIKPVPLTLPAEGWKKIAREFPEQAKTMEALIPEAGSSEEALLAVLRHLAAEIRALKNRELALNERDAEIVRREEHVLASAERIEELMQRYGKWEALREQSALLEAREKFVRDAEERLIRRAQELELFQEEIEQNRADLHTDIRRSKTQ